ncbi:glutathione-regulated potassium-efflux system protein KefB [Methylopila capsulata]|uniref:Glutathione-regulated potassium-efflux system protein KefB n=1 Tax=Methylopila capsulata TaxID=61654 RepID=A0A9W6IPC5_9HYPH|nr:monovalent cation:proton antiporter-2 (CPA2) family protein [Methylopila capsulata]MBM7850989.1 glutathione-regulated potassium-efflux system protein KefB [Methylopila capsulata]GLK54047.1 potassium efflux system protein [Methylopila capsulata]
MAAEGQSELVQVVALLGAGVVAVPIFRRLGLGSVLGYFAAGLVIGPFGLGLFSDPGAILHVAEFGVIMLLFVIGLEMQPSRLWALRREIFGLGVAQVVASGALLTLAGYAAGLNLAVAFVAGMGFVLSSTAVVMQMLDERGETSTAQGQKAVSILLLEDLAIVPLLAIVAFVAPADSGENAADRWREIAIAIVAVAGLVLAGRYLLNPMFRILARSQAREVMTAAALLVVLGAALLMELGGLSMAMGAFLAGVLLSESTFRHQLEADIEPFRGILLGLFFLAVGMSLDLAAISVHWPTILAFTALFIAVKAAAIFGVARLLGASSRESIDRVALFAQGGEFAFVLYSAASAVGIMDASTNAIFTSVVILSMALTPLTALALKRLMPHSAPSLDGVDQADGLSGEVLVIGFGRFAQVASQSLLARGFEVSIIENDVEMIEAAATFGFKVYYGDGTRLDTLRASGAGQARAVLVCVDKREAAEKIVELVQSEFPLAKLFVRAFDRGHAMDLVRAGVDYHIRETFESAMAFGEAALVALGVPEEEAAEIADDVRRRDSERFALQVAGDIHSGSSLIRGNAPIPTPLTRPRRAGQIVDQGEPQPEAS